MGEERTGLGKVRDSLMWLHYRDEKGKIYCIIDLKLGPEGEPIVIGTYGLDTCYEPVKIPMKRFLMHRFVEESELVEKVQTPAQKPTQAQLANAYIRGEWDY